MSYCCCWCTKLPLIIWSIFMREPNTIRIICRCPIGLNCTEAYRHKSTRNNNAFELRPFIPLKCTPWLNQCDFLHRRAAYAIVANIEAVRRADIWLYLCSFISTMESVMVPLYWPYIKWIQLLDVSRLAECIQLKYPVTLNVFYMYQSFHYNCWIDRPIHDSLPSWIDRMVFVCTFEDAIRIISFSHMKWGAPLIQPICCKHTHTHIH